MVCVSIDMTAIGSARGDGGTMVSGGVVGDREAGVRADGSFGVLEVAYVAGSIGFGLSRLASTVDGCLTVSPHPSILIIVSI